MVETYIADTHSLLWHIADSPNLGLKARRILDKADEGEAKIAFSAISLVETIYLSEKKKIPPERLQELLGKLKGSTNYFVTPVSFKVAIAIQKIDREKVPDMPDRIIVATAKDSNSTLITRDKNIRASGLVKTLW